MVVDSDVPLEVAQAAREKAEELAYIEAAKVHVILKSTVEKLALVGVITVDQQEQALALTKTVGEEIAALIKQQSALESEFAMLVTRQHELKHRNNRIKKEENDANIKLVAEKLRTSIGVLCGKLKDNPNVAENAAKVASERQMLQILLGKALDELATTRKIPCIFEMVTSEQYRRKEIRDMVEREKATTRAVSTLTLELHDENEQHEKAMQAMKVQNAKLKEDIKVQNEATYIESSHVRKELTGRHGSEVVLNDQEVEDLQEQLHSLQTRILLENSAHEAIQERANEFQTKFRQMAASWVSRTATDSATKAELLGELKSKHEVALAKFKEVQAEHSKEAVLKDAREKAARETYEAAELLKKRNAVENHAAERIQAFWRGYKVRQGSKGGKEKGKKGKRKK